MERDVDANNEFHVAEPQDLCGGYAKYPARPVGTIAKASRRLSTRMHIDTRTHSHTHSSWNLKKWAWIGSAVARAVARASLPVGRGGFQSLN